MLAFTRFVALICTLEFLLSGVNNAELANKEWWENTLVYQIWPRGFQDSDGDGEGDLKGIINRLDYIKNLGIETICLNPIYSSPLIDAGYDVSNFMEVHPLFGNLDDFDNLVQEIHNRGLRIILDIVPNHSSDEHEWFQLSTQNVKPYTNYYIWANGSIDDDGKKIPPNNWVSTYSDEEGSAWTWHERKQQWYYHKYHTSQPDLNLRNEEVIKEIMDILDFWLDRDVDGFRINAVPYFVEDEALRNEPVGGFYTFGLSESTALLYLFRRHVDEWVSRNNVTSKLLIAESYDADDNLIDYYGNGTHNGIPPINFKFITHIHNSSSADYIKYILEEWIKLLPENAGTNWVLSNHDNSRAASRIGLNRVDGLHMLSLLLPGQAHTYYGDELGMLDTKVLWNRTLDPMGCAKGIEKYEYFSRDPARTPMQWNSEISAGFSTNETTYLPIHSNYINRNVQAQLNRKRSNLKTYKELAALRKGPVFVNGDYEFKSLNNNRVLVLKRFLKNHPLAYIIVINLGLRQEQVNLSLIYPYLKDTLEIVVASSNALYVKGVVQQNNFILTANAALVLRSQEETGHTPIDPTVTTETDGEVTNNSTKATTLSTSETTSSPGNKTSSETTEKTTESTKTSTTKDPNSAANLTPAVQLVISLIIAVIASYRI
ncbi:alpha-glucosidase isoform X2 [Ooceraea biroi]|uniref:alpha-glucosidase n=1 Tax=Ooceraea biroi TaxID=2015173 RepID=A0A026WFL3_OOCBI|nr:alpha-glucosidase isoform X2 [Ooceraea biroi]EZA54842.1 Maltase [Ooceraea biroi]